MDCRPHHLRNSHKFESILFISADESVHCLDCVRSIGSEFSMSAVVKQHHIAASNTPADLAFNIFGRRRIPIEPGDVPHHRSKSQLPCDAEHRRPARAPWRTEQIRMLAYGVGERSLALREFVPNSGSRLQSQKGMSERVIANNVPSPCDLSCDIGPLLHIAPDHKKSRTNLVAGEDVQQIKRMRIVGPVVESERNLSRRPSQSTKGAPHPLAGRCHGLVSGSNGSCCRQSNCQFQHGRIMRRDCRIVESTNRRIWELTRRQSVNP